MVSADSAKTDLPPTVYIVHGDDQAAIQQTLQGMIAKVGSPELAQMNITRLDAGHAPRQDLTVAAQMIPFGVPRRMVILENALAGIKGNQQEQEFLSFLSSLPPTTALVLLIHDSQKWKQGKMRWQVLHEKHWLMQWHEDKQDFTYRIELPKPNRHSMPGWIAQQVKVQGGSFERGAAITLAELVGQDTLLARQEITKLLTYAGTGRLVTKQDVDLLCAPVPQEDIFGMVDAIGNGDGKKALKLLNTLLQHQPEVIIFNMIVRQFRLLIIAKEVQQEGGSQNRIAQEAGVRDFVARNLINQTRRFSIQQLEDIYKQLYQLEVRMKSGKISPQLAMELFIVEVTGKSK